MQDDFENLGIFVTAALGKVVSFIRYFCVGVFGLIVFFVFGAIFDGVTPDDSVFAGYLPIVATAFACGLGLALFDYPRSKRKAEAFAASMREPQNPTNVIDGVARPFTADLAAQLWVPEAIVAIDAATRSLQIASRDLIYNVAIPIALIRQIEFDPGDGPPRNRHPGMSWKREWLSLPFVPTIYLGIDCIASDETFIFPLCFAPQHEAEARAIHQLLCTTKEMVTEPLSFPLSAEALDERLPGSFEARYLRTAIVQKFWPDYRPRSLREWLNR